MFSDGAVSLHTRSLKYGKVSELLGCRHGQASPWFLHPQKAGSGAVPRAQGMLGCMQASGPSEHPVTPVQTDRQTDRRVPAGTGASADCCSRRPGTRTYRCSARGRSAGTVGTCLRLWGASCACSGAPSVMFG